jgi:hypothetical protein
MYGGGQVVWMLLNAEEIKPTPYPFAHHNIEAVCIAVQY